MKFSSMASWLCPLFARFVHVEPRLFVWLPSSLIAKYGCHCAYTNENSDKDNQRATSDVVFLLSKNYLKSFYRAFYSSFTLLRVCGAHLQRYKQVFRLRSVLH